MMHQSQLYDPRLGAFETFLDGEGDISGGDSLGTGGGGLADAGDNGRRHSTFLPLTAQRGANRRDVDGDGYGARDGDDDDDDNGIDDDDDEVATMASEAAAREHEEAEEEAEAEGLRGLLRQAEFHASLLNQMRDAVSAKLAKTGHLRRLRERKAYFEEHKALLNDRPTRLEEIRRRRESRKADRDRDRNRDRDSDESAVPPALACAVPADSDSPVSSRPRSQPRSHVRARSQFHFLRPASTYASTSTVTVATTADTGPAGTGPPLPLSSSRTARRTGQDSESPSPSPQALPHFPLYAPLASHMPARPPRSLQFAAADSIFSPIDLPPRKTCVCQTLDLSDHTTCSVASPYAWVQSLTADGNRDLPTQSQRALARTNDAAAAEVEVVPSVFSVHTPTVSAPSPLDPSPSLPLDMQSAQHGVNIIAKRAELKRLRLRRMRDLKNFRAVRKRLEMYMSLWSGTDRDVAVTRDPVVNCAE